MPILVILLHVEAIGQYSTNKDLRLAPILNILLNELTTSLFIAKLKIDAD